MQNISRARLSRRNLLVCLAAGTLFATGCGGGGISGTVPVTGKVTYNGAPVAGATVSFIGDQASLRPAVAITEADGTFKLKTLDSEGAMPGSYTVAVEKTEMPAELTREMSMEEAESFNPKSLPAPKRVLPAKYSDPAQSGLKFEVKAGEANNFDLQLTD